MITSANADNLIDSDPAQPLHESRDKNATSENSSDLKPTISATVKLVLCIVRDSADAFPPLKSVAGAICSILENYEVRFTSHPPPSRCSHSSSERKKTSKR